MTEEAIQASRRWVCGCGNSAPFECNAHHSKPVPLCADHAFRARGARLEHCRSHATPGSRSVATIPLEGAGKF